MGYRSYLPLTTGKSRRSRGKVSTCLWTSSVCRMIKLRLKGYGVTDPEGLSGGTKAGLAGDGEVDSSAGEETGLCVTHVPRATVEVTSLTTGVMSTTTSLGVGF